MEHKSRIENRIMAVHLVAHFLEKNHIPDDLKFMVIQKFIPHPYNSTNINKALQCLEVTWIYRLHTLIPDGFNQSLDFNFNEYVIYNYGSVYITHCHCEMFCHCEMLCPVYMELSLYEAHISPVFNFKNVVF